MVFLVLLLLLGLLLFVLSLSLILVCFLLSIMSSFLVSVGSILRLGMVGLLGSLSSLLSGVILSFSCFGSRGGIRDRCRSGGLLSNACLTVLGLCCFVSSFIGLSFHQLVLDVRLDALIVIFDFTVLSLVGLTILALLKLGLDSRDLTCLLCRSGSSLSFSACLSCFGFFDLLVGRGDIISALLARCLTSGLGLLV